MRPKMTKRLTFGNPSTKPVQSERNESNGNLSLRRFATFLAMFLASSLWNLQAAPAPAKTKPPSPIYSLRDPDMVESFNIQADRVSKNFDLLIATAGGSSNPTIAWKKWIKPGQRIGIKISTMPGKITGTHQPLVDAIIASLIKAGHSPSNILVFDRYAAEMRDAGWTMGKRADQVRVTAISPQTGYDPQVVYSCPYAGKLIWGDLEFKGQQWKQSDDDKGQLSNKSYFSTIVTQKVDVLINVPVLTTREGVGVYGAIATLPLGVIDNQRRFFKPFFGREENIADLCTHKALHGKWVLTIMAGLLGQYAGGPAFDPKYTWPHSAIWLSEDPVGLDALALKLINEHRPPENIKVIDPDDTAYLKSCEALGFGSTDLSGDRVREIGLPVSMDD